VPLRSAAYTLLMSRDFDYHAEAEEAMREAAAATTAVERIEWVQLAVAWQDLARGSSDPDGAEAARGRSSG
jgi:hypothetical protein